MALTGNWQEYPQYRMVEYSDGQYQWKFHEKIHVDGPGGRTFHKWNSSAGKYDQIDAGDVVNHANWDSSNIFHMSNTTHESGGEFKQQFPLNEDSYNLFNESGASNTSANWDPTSGEMTGGGGGAGDDGTQYSDWSPDENVQSPELDYLASGFGATWDGTKYVLEDGTEWVPEWDQLKDYTTDPKVKAAIGKYKKEAKVFKREGKGLLEMAKDYKPGSTGERAEIEQVSGDVSTTQQRAIGQTQEGLGAKGYGSGIGGLMGAAMERSMAPEMEAVSTRVKQQRLGEFKSLTQQGTGLMGKYLDTQQNIYSMEDTEATRKEDRYKAQLELINQMSGQAAGLMSGDDITRSHEEWIAGDDVKDYSSSGNWDSGVWSGDMTDDTGKSVAQVYQDGWGTFNGQTVQWTELYETHWQGNEGD